MNGLGRVYERFLGAAAISSLGDGLLLTGLPLLARQATKNPVLISLVFIGGRIPWLVALVLGSIADRRDARTVMMRVDLYRAVVLVCLGFAIVVLERSIPIVALASVALLLEAGQIMFFAASQRTVPFLVSDDQLETANSRHSTLTTGAEVIGPQLGAVFLTGGFIPVVGDALSFFGSAVLLRALPGIPPEETKTNLRTDVAAGWTWFRQCRPLLLITVLMTCVAGISGAVLATEVVLIVDTLHKPGWWFGPFTITLSAGTMFGSWFAPRVIRFLGKRTITTAAVVMGTCYFGIAGSRLWPVVFVLMFLQQGFTAIGGVSLATFRQRIIPAHLRGRVVGLNRSFGIAMQIVCAAIGGVIAKRHGTDPIFAIGGLLTIALAMGLVRPIQRALRTRGVAID